MADLLSAVDALTKTESEHHVIMSDYGVYRAPVYVRTHTVTHPPLLERLREAVNPSKNTAAGSSALASTRNLIDSDALYEYSKMTSAIGSWCRAFKADRTRDPVTDLRRWYVAFQQYDNEPQWYIDELRHWATLIRNILEPPKRIEITEPCPVCGKRAYTDQDGNELLFPVIIEYRVPKDEDSIIPKALCRACQTVWAGYDAVAELADELKEHAERTG